MKNIMAETNKSCKNSKKAYHNKINFNVLFIKALNVDS